MNLGIGNRESERQGIAQTCIKAAGRLKRSDDHASLGRSAGINQPHSVRGKFLPHAVRLGRSLFSSENYHAQRVRKRQPVRGLHWVDQFMPERRGQVQYGTLLLLRPLQELASL